MSDVVNGKHRAGLVTLNAYSHFSGSETDNSAFSVPQLMSS